ncbi:MAG: sigma-70 family RNA polymerase sigma factor [Limisphaerales bacterium]|jgi:RNA polymerase primary sigma factor
MIKELNEPHASRTTPDSTPSASRNGYSSLQLYLEEISPWSRVSATEEKRLLSRCRQGDLSSRTALILSHLKWVVAIARSFRSHSAHLLELTSEGNIALIQSLDSFEAKSNARLATYAYPRVRGAMIQAIHRINRVVRIPDYQLRKQNAQGKSSTRSRCNPALQNSIEDQRAPLPIESIPAPETESAGTQLNPEIDYYLSQLNPHEQYLLQLRFGLQGQKPHTLSAIGKISGVTHEAVRQRLEKTLQRLREIPT